ncbi:hypothetical protein GCM10007938_02510 [Vibrio zhanjiangensis]|uniref:DNA-directed DNA polymerase n=1 Tax=Vibrio zhanjiangensis TaxID=1046128 RepID=A0ABQ6EVB4_9VIBR|nr:hypothetical protein GCM10007938_02510 [Vibrio zhanjiangensis]
MEGNDFNVVYPSLIHQKYDMMASEPFHYLIDKVLRVSNKLSHLGFSRADMAKF